MDNEPNWQEILEPKVLETLKKFHNQGKNIFRGWFTLTGTNYAQLSATRNNDDTFSAQYFCGDRGWFFKYPLSELSKEEPKP